MPSDSFQPEHPPRRVHSRLGALKIFGGGLFGGIAGAAVGRTPSARAADGQGVVLGSANTSASSTTITSSALGGSALVVSGTAANAAIEGNSASIGVLGNASTGVMGVGDVGGVFSGDANAIQLNPQAASGAPTSGDHLKGDMLVDADGVLWLCIADGNPGSWIRVSHGGVRPLDIPQRAYDSRQTGGKFSNGESRSIQVVGSAVNGAVPFNAVAVVGNLTITETVGGGFVTLWPTGKTQPQTSNINWSTGNTTVANGFSIGVGSGGQISVITVGTLSSTTHLIVDITGYVL